MDQNIYRQNKIFIYEFVSKMQSDDHNDQHQVKIPYNIHVFWQYINALNIGPTKINLSLFQEQN